MHDERCALTSKRRVRARTGRASCDRANHDLIAAGKKRNIPDVQYLQISANARVYPSPGFIVLLNY